MTTLSVTEICDRAADCIDIDDEIGRRTYTLLIDEVSSGRVALTVAPADEGTTLTLSRVFPAKFAGRCALSGVWFGPGEMVAKSDRGMVTNAALNLWGFGHVSGDTCRSPYAAPAEAVVAAGLAAGKMVTTLNRQGQRRCWKMVGDKVEECSALGGRAMLTNRKSPAAFWSTVASKAQAVRVE